MNWKRDDLFSEGGREAKISWDAHLKDPWHWIHQAWMFKRAAEEIDTFSLVGRGFSNITANERDRELLIIIPVYRFLVGISFENLLKGIIIAHGEIIASDGKLLTWFKSHDLPKLVQKIDKNRISISAEEIGMLAELKDYLIWQGRYPIPTDTNHHVVGFVFSSTAHAKEVTLWSRLYRHAKELIKPNGG